MTSFLIALLLPGLFWDRGPETASDLKGAGINRIYVPEARAGEWRKTGLEVMALSPAQLRSAIALKAPGIQMKMNVAAATSAPWIDANGWQFTRNPRRLFIEDVRKRAEQLAAAEAFAFGAEAALKIAPGAVAPFGRMLAFLRTVERPELPVLANIGIYDDGSALVAEVLNLLARRNLLFKIVSAPDPTLDLNVRIGSDEYPRAAAENPAEFASKVRAQLTDEKRLLRIFGSDVVLGRLTGEGRNVRLHLINYSGHKVLGLRVRVLGTYTKVSAFESSQGSVQVRDLAAVENATEFNIPELGVYAVVDLTRQ